MAAKKTSELIPVGVAKLEPAAWPTKPAASEVVAHATAEMVLAPRPSTVSLLESVMIMAYFFDTIASTVSATLRADSCVSAVA
jgi:hypothetical protein